jgi:hypothetical protein
MREIDVVISIFKKSLFVQDFKWSLIIFVQICVDIICFSIWSKQQGLT